MAKGRGTEGEKNALARYSNAQVREFREQFDKVNMTIREFAILHGAAPATMRSILKRKTYRNA